MMQRSEPLPICPDCGGLLQPIDPERLTSSEVAAGRSSDDVESPSQCLICGYQVPARVVSETR